LIAANGTLNNTSALMGGGWPPVVINGQTRKSAYVWPIKNPPERVYSVGGSGNGIQWVTLALLF
ncbi:TPA: hypothetical protein ACHQLR_004776, partial [Enterobacter hormaechei]